MTITSLQNPRVKNAVKLRRRHDRQRQGRMIIDGVREVGRALDAGIDLQQMFICSELCSAEGLDLRDCLRTASIEVLDVSPSVFSKLAFGKRAEGIVAVARTPREEPLCNRKLAGTPLLAVLESVEKPGNVGAVLRSADATGVTGLIVADGGTDLYNPNSIRASSGAIFSVPLYAVTSEETVAWLQENRIRVFAACVEGSVSYTDVCYREPCAIVLGSEAKGLSDVWRGRETTAISLPMRGTVDSLNVSTTAAVLFYEALRQRS